jgi:hypothetical protein
MGAALSSSLSTQLAAGQQASDPLALRCSQGGPVTPPPAPPATLVYIVDREGLGEIDADVDNGRGLTLVE